jgi:hypothetical protein
MTLYEMYYLWRAGYCIKHKEKKTSYNDRRIAKGETVRILGNQPRSCESCEIEKKKKEESERARIQEIARKIIEK